MLFVVIVAWAVAVAGATLQLFLSKKPRTATRVLGLFLVWLLAVSGVQNLLAGLSHILNGPAVAALIGWPADNPFQFEVGVADIGFGILGIMCVWERGRFWLATIVVTSVFGFGVAAGHIQQILVAGNYNPGNAGVPLYMDIIGPVVSIALYIAYRVSLRRHPERAAEMNEERPMRMPRGRAHPAM